MAINKNHEFDELDGIKCAIVERNASAERVQFLKQILELNQFTVVVAASPPPKASPVPATASAAIPTEEDAEKDSLPQPSPTYTIGVTDVSFNPINAIFGRLLKTKTGHTVTLAYWKQKEEVPRDDLPYFDN